MAQKKSGYIDVDKLMPHISIEQVAAYYGVDTGEIHRTGQEIRTRCFLACGKSEETGDRALAICADDPAKRWKCHQYECQKGGNLIGLCDLLKSGTSSNGRPRGERFKAIARDLQAMASGQSPAESKTPTAGSETTQATKSPKPVPENIPLKDSDNERARALVDLDQKFLADPAEMPPAAASYFRQRRYLTPKVCQEWRVGYLSRDSGGDRAGGTMRGKVVYPVLESSGDVLTWFGRDPEYETKRQKWVAANKEGREPAKFHFVRGFHRGQELFGQHRIFEMAQETRGNIERLGLLVVEGPNDVIAMAAQGDTAVGLMSNLITDEQVEKIVNMAQSFADGHVVLMLDSDAEGQRGAYDALQKLSEHCYVRLAWSTKTDNGRYQDMQPESLSAEDWQTLRSGLERG